MYYICILFINFTLVEDLESDTIELVRRAENVTSALPAMMDNISFIKPNPTADNTLSRLPEVPRQDDKCLHLPEQKPYNTHLESSEPAVMHQISHQHSKHGDTCLDSSKPTETFQDLSKHGDSCLGSSKHVDGCLGSSGHAESCLGSSKQAPCAADITEESVRKITGS